MRKELQSPEEFDEEVREEIRLSSEMDLPLHALSVLLPGGPDADPARLLEEIRRADLVTTGSSGEVSLVLPNTSPNNAWLVARRLLAAVPGAEIGEAVYSPDDTPQTFLDRARQNRAG
ncbi:hypothetical protein [Rubrobacter aplysinae]|uniref:hypothetical protein n=1 Tax=Rubrobacter aplysinae TaxID=909625 RepID=UPI00064BAF7D|nr:hypothetical protein [Rubrobacter aplysinae]